MNKGVYLALLSIGIAQGLKIPIHYLKKKQWRPELFFQTGGMPSAHSAGVSSLTTYIALDRGLPTIDFALSLIYGLIVMYDAQGIRRQAGELTLKVNDIDEMIAKIRKQEAVEFEEKPPEKLKEVLGHEPEEVLGGSLLGVCIGALGYYFLGSKKKQSRLVSRIF